MYVKKEKKCTAYVSKNSSNLKKQVTFLMIPSQKKCKVKYEGHVANSEGQWWHYLAVKKYQHY